MCSIGLVIRNKEQETWHYSVPQMRKKCKSSCTKWSGAIHPSFQLTWLSLIYAVGKADRHCCGWIHPSTTLSPKRDQSRTGRLWNISSASRLSTLHRTAVSAQFHCSTAQHCCNTAATIRRGICCGCVHSQILSYCETKFPLYLFCVQRVITIRSRLLSLILRTDVL